MLVASFWKNYDRQGHSGKEMVLQFLLGSGIACSRVVLPRCDAIQNRLMLQHASGDAKAVVNPASLLTESFGDELCPAAFAALLRGELKTKDEIMSWLRSEDAEPPLFCGRCGQEGHVMQDCPRVAQQKQSGTSRDLVASETSMDLPKALTSHRVNLSVPTTVSDLRHLLSLAPARHGHGRDEGEELVSIANAETPRAFEGVQRALQAEAEKPSIHRRVYRCAYCHGPHHITKCPRLEEKEPSEADIAAGATGELPEQTRLFCIRCGQHGHMFQRCPTLPVGMPIALFCAVCHSQLSKVLHSAESCPRRIAAPPGFNARGMHLSLVGQLPSKKKHGARADHHDMLQQQASKTRAGISSR
jgi:hypothetical protein